MPVSHTCQPRVYLVSGGCCHRLLTWSSWLQHSGIAPPRDLPSAPPKSYPSTSQVPLPPFPIPSLPLPAHRPPSSLAHPLVTLPDLISRHLLSPFTSTLHSATSFVWETQMLSHVMPKHLLWILCKIRPLLSRECSVLRDAALGLLQAVTVATAASRHVPQAQLLPPFTPSAPRVSGLCSTSWFLPRVTPSSSFTCQLPSDPTWMLPDTRPSAVS